MACTSPHDDPASSSDEAEIRTLLSATLLYRRIFPSCSSLSLSHPTHTPFSPTAVSAILSPPPSPPSMSSPSGKKSLALHMSLRAALASPAFDCADERFGGSGSGVRGGEGEEEMLCARLDRARDRVNDALTAVERSVRRNVRL